ncbi:MAG: HesA/MoeB/ThiF family protein [Anaerovoracaceae bacterium]|jgi:molybdopterin/thiamine biosynthesis adenylyltransferase
MGFTKEQQERFSRQLNLKELGPAGQKKLLDGSVLIIGAGGLGSPAAMYLAAAGVGRIGIADADAVDRSNLQRQIIHKTENIGKPKALSAEERIREIDPEIRVETYCEYISKENIREIVPEYDFVLDCTDNIRTKFLINDACVLTKTPFCHAGVIRFEGQLMTWVPDAEVPCYRCVFGGPPEEKVPTCRDVGVIGAAVGVIGSLQALEAVKYLTGIGSLLMGRLLIFDGLKMEFRTVALPPKGDGCAVCSDHPTITI